MASIFLKAAKPAFSLARPQRWLGTAAKAAGDISRAVAQNQKLREDLALSYRALAYYNLHEAVDNHLSVRAPARDGNGEVMLIISHGIHWSRVTASSLIGIDFESGEVIEGDGAVEEAAKNIHMAIHKVKAPDGIKCVMHTHQPYTTALACCQGRLLNIHQNSMRFHNKVSYDDTYGGVADVNESDSIAESFAGKDICFMSNHGVTVVAKRVCDAFDDLYTLERACMYQVLAMSTGMKPVVAPDHIAEQLANYEIDYYRETHFEAMRGVIADMKPDYRS